jgi:hypothetical protein
MTILTDFQDPTYPTAATSVRVYRRDGRPRRRFSKPERLAALGGHEHELEVFQQLFAPKKYPYIIQRQQAGTRQTWRTVNHAITLDLIARHLLADKLPGADIIWVGTRAWEKTKYVTIDVDYRGDSQSFSQRCEKVERALYTLGIPRKSWLIQPTPSGGRHYFFFTSRPVLTWEIRLTLELAGLAHSNGQHEVYPDENHGLRLPFGWIPGRVHDPEAWLRFIQAYQADEFPRANWDRCKQRAEQHAERQLELQPTRPSSPAPMGVPKAERIIVNQGMTASAGPATRPKDIDDLWQRGITASGERLDATKKLAWHFIFAQGMSEEEAINKITAWVYRTGQNTSKDVRADLKCDKQKVAEQTRQIVAWFAARRLESGT